MQNHSKFLLFLCAFFLSIGTISAQLLSPQVDSIPMRDGKKLAADVYLPGTGTYPVVLIQTPYNRLLFRFGLPLGVGTNLSGQPFAFVVADWRGFYGSAGAFSVSANRGEDGYDVVQWIAGQSWSNGKVGTWGPSALGNVQFETARENPPNLVCAVPIVCDPQQSYPVYYPNGVRRTEFVTQLGGLGYGTSLILSEYLDNAIWQFAASSTWYPQDVKVPMLMIGGWYDHNTDQTLKWFEGIRTSSDPGVRDDHKLLMGPWTHGGHGSANPGDSLQGQLPYANASGYNQDFAVRFMEYYLLGNANGWDTLPEVTYYEMGTNQWVSAGTWPPATNSTSWYLSANNSLSTTAPASTEDSLGFMADPRDPSPTIGGPTLLSTLDQGPYDQVPMVESRPDALVFSSDVLSQRVVVNGQPEVNLFVKTDQADTDFSVRLTDVYPDGRSMLVADGIFRMRFRNSTTTEFDTLTQPNGTIYPISITLQNTCLSFEPGHKIRLVISGSNYPRYDVNLNNGDSLYVAGDSVVAHNRVVWGSAYLSSLVLPQSPSALGMPELIGEEKPIVYPNPAQNQLFVRFANPLQGPVAWRMVGLDGREMAAGKDFLNGNLLELEPSLPSGIYILDLQTTAGTFREKVFIHGN